MSQLRHCVRTTPVLMTTNNCLCPLRSDQANVKKLRGLIKDGAWEEAVIICKQLLKRFTAEKSLAMADRCSSSTDRVVGVVGGGWGWLVHCGAVKE